MRKYINQIFLTTLLLIGAGRLFAQKILLPFDRITMLEVNRQLYELDTNIHFSYKPLLLNKSEYDTIMRHVQKRLGAKHREKWGGRKLFNENLAVLQAKDFYLTIDPLMNFEFGRDLDDGSNGQVTTNTRGILIQGNITEKVYFRTDFYETQSYFPTYMDSMILSSGAVPGQGKAKPFKTNGYDYPLVTGIVNFQASKNVNLQFGQDKMFIGNGYRSLLLSDNSSPFLFLQAGLSLFENKLNYHANWSALQTLVKVHGGGGDDLFARKQANFNYVSFKPNSIWEIGLFEGVIWERWNENSYSQDFDPLFINPVPFVNSFAKKSDTLVNSILGMNVFVKPFTYTSFYGQLSYGLEKEGVGFQVGTKLYEVLGIEGLSLQAEYNQVGGNVYGVKNDYVDYFHYNQPLAVQQMEDFSEVILIGNYRHKRFLLYAKASLADVVNPSIGDVTIQNYEANLGYIFNPITNLMVNAGVRHRDHSVTGSTNWVYFGLKTNLRNLYYDF